MKLKRAYHLAALIIGGMIFTFSASVVSAQSLEGYVTEGENFENIRIDKSTIKDVIAIYGENYELINHKGYSYELSYKNLGLSFYACQSDPKKKIFVVEFQLPFRVTTSKGIVLGESTLGDVYRIYNSYGERDYSDSGQKGIFFFVGDEISPDKAYQPAIYQEGSEELELHKSKKIIRIDLVGKSGLRQCKLKSEKSEDK